MKSFLQFTKVKAGHHIVTNGYGDPVGTIDPKGQIFKKRIVFTDVNGDCEWTTECLRRTADFIESLENRERRNKQRRGARN